MFHRMCGIWLLLLGGFAVPGVRHVSGITIYTSRELEVVNGTSARLKCTFSSTHRVTLETALVSWNFRPLTGTGPDESVFFYQGTPFPPDSGRFKDHAVWSGDILRGDASITLNDVRPTFNGTYTCQVHNPPDVHGHNGELTLRVVNQAAPLSEISILIAAVGGACGVILILLGIIMCVRFCRRKRMENDIELEVPEKHRRDPTVCSPEEALHLNVIKPKKEVDSSDDEESEPSSGGGDEESSEGDGDDDDDDDDDGGDDDDD